MPDLNPAEQFLELLKTKLKAERPSMASRLQEKGFHPRTKEIMLVFLDGRQASPVQTRLL